MCLLTYQNIFLLHLVQQEAGKSGEGAAFGKRMMSQLPTAAVVGGHPIEMSGDTRNCHSSSPSDEGRAWPGSPGVS